MAHVGALQLRGLPIPREIDFFIDHHHVRFRCITGMICRPCAMGVLNSLFPAAKYSPTCRFPPCANTLRFPCGFNAAKYTLLKHYLLLFEGWNLLCEHCHSFIIATPKCMRGIGGLFLELALTLSLSHSGDSILRRADRPAAAGSRWRGGRCAGGGGSGQRGGVFGACRGGVLPEHFAGKRARAAGCSAATDPLVNPGP